jgi:hypothetical protein
MNWDAVGATAETLAFHNFGGWIKDGWFLQWWEVWEIQFPPEFRVFITEIIEENA